jgi:hypothetical protein
VAVDSYTIFSDINNVNYYNVMAKVMSDKKPGEVYDRLDQVTKTDQIRTIVKQKPVTA